MKIRRYFRQPVIHPAVLRLPDTPELTCEIRNFSPAGLMLALAGAGAEKSIPRERRDEAELVFGGTEEEEDEPFLLRGRLAYATPRGVGFVFDHPPPLQVLRVLQEKARPKPGRQDFPADWVEIHARCVQAFEGMLGVLHETLIEAILRERPGGEEQPELSSAEAGQIQLAVERFCRHALAQAKSFIVPELSLQPEPGAIYSESQADRLLFEDWMNVIDKVIQLESRFEAALRELEPRLGLLAQRDMVSHDNPFGPSTLCHSLSYALKTLDLDNPRRNRVYDALRGRLEDQLPKLYADLLAFSKPLEGLKTGAAKAEDSVHPQFLTDTVVASPFQPSLFSGADAQPFFAPSPAKPPTDDGQTARGATAPGRASRKAPPPADAYSAFVMLFRYAEGQAHKNPTHLNSEADRNAIITALQKLKASSGSHQIPFFNAPWLHAGLGQILAETAQEKVLATAEVRENLQIIGLLLDAMLGDPTLPACVVPYIKRMQIPLLIASFSDQELLHGHFHPGREIFNQLDCLTQAANFDGEIDNPELVANLDSIFALLSTEVDDNPNAFGNALESLKRLTAPLAKAYVFRLDRVAESCEGGHRLEQARRLVDREIDARLAGKTVPAIVPALLDAGWRQLMVLTGVRMDTDSGGWREQADNDDWKRQLAVVDLLLAWLGKKPPANPPSPANVQGLLKYVQEKLPTTATVPADTGLIIGKLEKLLANIGGETDPAAYIDMPALDPSREQKETAFRNRLQGFRVGEWLKFASTRGAWIPLRLAWIGDNPGRYVFVNRKGIKTLDIDAPKFAQFLDEKRASRMENLDELSLMERTAKSLLSTLRDRLR